MTYITRTPEEIVARIRDPETDDFLGTERDDLLEFVAYEHVKELLMPTTEENIAGWNETRKTPTREVIIAEMKGYFPFAWGKAQDGRGISASRSISHYSAWVWLLNDGHYAEFRRLADTNYASYGVPVLKWLKQTYALGENEL